MKTIITNLKKRYQKPLAIILLLCASSCWIQPVKAEGSKELAAEGGNRPYLEWSASGTTAGIERRTTFQVFVQKGEIVNLGSSVINSFDGKDITYSNSFAGQSGVCDVTSSGDGLIDTVAKETKGPEVTSGDGGYKPCQFTAVATGFYEIQFHAPRDTGDPTPKLTTEQFPIDNAQGQTVAAWDITVRDSAGVTKPGRVLTNYVALNMGGSGLSLNSKLYVQTKDGYRYETDMNQLDPYGFIFFANSRGYLDPTNPIDSTKPLTLYHSAKATTSDLNPFQGNIKVQNPEIDDTDTDITHLIFINRPDPLTLDALSIPRVPIPPSPPSNFKFTGVLGTSGNQTTVGAGGNFSFNSSTAGTYQIIIDTNADGIFNPSTDRVLQNPVLAGSNTVFWDGKKANGTDAPPLPGNQPYKAQINIRGGEYHFPMLDVENNPFGLKITLENAPTAYPPILDKNGQQIGKNTIYYNDDNYTTGNNITVDLSGTGATNPSNALAGVDSSTGGHKFSNNYGDFKGIDTWSYFPSSTVTTDLVIIYAVKGTKSVRFLTDNDNSASVTVGDKVEYTITYSNATPAATSDINDFIINDTLPSQLTFVSVAIASQTNSSNITINSSYNGSGALTNSGTLPKGATITIKVIATINSNNSGTPIANQASADFTTPGNSDATSTAVTDADGAGATTNPPAVNNYFPQTSDDNVNSGNDPTRTNDDDPTLITVTVPGQPKLRLVKRVTDIGGFPITAFHNVTAATTGSSNTADDDAPNWITNPVYLKGAFDSSDPAQVPADKQPKPGDEVEYKIYFLADGTVNSQDVKICDFIPNDSTYVANSLKLTIGNSASVPVTDAIGGTDTDGGFYDTATVIPAACTGTNNSQGAVLVNVGTVNFSTGVGTPTTSYGSISFRVKVK
jgi:fimbrial isopeptide formation D2 family protein/uncharacterized repeat protein (TIGR01451 family)